MNNKAQKIMLGIIIALLVAVIVIQLVVKHKVKLDNGSTGTSGVFLQSASAPQSTEVLIESPDA